MDNSGNVLDGVSLSKLTTKNKVTVTLFAVWEKVVAEKSVITATKEGSTIKVKTVESDTAANSEYEIQYSTNIMFRNAESVDSATELLQAPGAREL